MLPAECIATLVPHGSPFVINDLEEKRAGRIRNSGFQATGYSKFGRKQDFTAVQVKNWADPPAGQTSGSVSGSALKSMRQRLCSAAGLAG
jgi:hypothetical protein